jgi:predicted dehydrogenase
MMHYFFDNAMLHSPNKIHASKTVNLPCPQNEGLEDATMKRRAFMKLTGSSAVAWSAASSGLIHGANDRIRIGLIGCGSRGSYDAQIMRGTAEDIQAAAAGNYHGGNLDPRLKEPRNVEIAGLCDVFGSRMESARKWAPQAKTYSDFRRMLEDRDIDAVIIATPDQWHASMLILACEAGKDVYLEKPVMYRIAEAKAMIEAVRRNKRIVQIGTQHRAADHIAEAAKIIQSGKIGEVHFVRVWNYMNALFGSPPVPDSEAPPDLNWDAWLGPAPQVPFNRNRLNYRSFMDYTNGIISDFGNHRFDSIHQIMGAEKPNTVASSTIRFNRKTAGDIYDMQTAIYEYPDFILNYEACNYNGLGLGGRTPGMEYYSMRGPENRPHGMAFYGTDAALFVDRIGMELYSEPKPPEGRGAAMFGSSWEPRMEKIMVNEDEPTPLHTKYFIDNLRSRREPFSNIENGARATAVACMGNIAAWTGQKLEWDSESFSFGSNEDANRHLFRPYRKPWDLVSF